MDSYEKEKNTNRCDICFDNKASASLKFKNNCPVIGCNNRQLNKVDYHNLCNKCFKINSNFTKKALLFLNQSF